VYRSDACKAEYNRLTTEWLAREKSIPHTGQASPELTVNELLVRFWSYAEKTS
jgi:hypothetical protein